MLNAQRAGNIKMASKWFEKRKGQNRPKRSVNWDLSEATRK